MDFGTAPRRKNFQPRDFRVFHEEWKGNAVFNIWEIDPKGEKVGEGPFLSIGKFRARIILRFVEELRGWVDGFSDKKD